MLVAQSDRIRLVAHLNLFESPAEPIVQAKQIDAQWFRSPFLQQANVRGGPVRSARHVRAAHYRSLDRNLLQADPRRGQILVGGRSHPPLRIRLEFHQLDIKRQVLVGQYLLGHQSRLWDDDHVLNHGIGIVDDGQFERPRVHDEIDRLTLRDAHLAFDGRDADQQLAEHHQADAQVQHDDSRALVKDEVAAQQHYGPNGRALDQQPGDPQRRPIGEQLQLTGRLTLTGGNHDDRQANRRQQDHDARSQSRSAGLNLEPDQVSRHQVREQHHTD